MPNNLNEDKIALTQEEFDSLYVIEQDESTETETEAPTEKTEEINTPTSKEEPDVPQWQQDIDNELEDNLEW